MAQALAYDSTYCSLSRSGTEELAAEITRLSGYIYAATYRLLVLIREFDEIDGWHQCGMRSCAHWLNFKCGIGLNAARYQVVVHVTAETSRRVACDCSVVPVRENAKGEPLSIGRKSRTIPPAIRRALKIRDGGCRFPGCTNTRFVDGHHIQHWADDGETCLDNLVLLCRHHHTLVHEGAYDCRRTIDGEVYFTGPDKRRMPEHVRMSPIEERSNAWFNREVSKQQIHPLTCVPQWYAGDDIDWHEAVSVLFLQRQVCR